MFLILILSLVLIWMQVSSLRFLAAVKNNSSILNQAEQVEQRMPKDRNMSSKSLPVLFSLGIVLFFNLVEIGYFVFSVYIFNDFFISLGGSIMVGYSIYTIIKFVPQIKVFLQKPAQYLKQKTMGLERILNLVMSSIEIVLCSYILIKLLIKYKVF